MAVGEELPGAIRRSAIADDRNADLDAEATVLPAGGVAL